MPIHDWRRVEAGIFHDFHHAWIEEIKRALNAGLLPDEYYALAEQHAAGFGPDTTTENGGVGLLILDLLPPTPRDPGGIHAAIWEDLTGQTGPAVEHKPLTLAAYESALSARAYVEPVAVGDPLPDMPLYLRPEGYVLVPLRATYPKRLPPCLAAGRLCLKEINRSVQHVRRESFSIHSYAMLAPKLSTYTTRKEFPSRCNL